MTYLQIGVPLGIVLGNFLTSLIKDHLGWQYAFIIQSIMIASLMVITLFIPNKYFSATYRARYQSYRTSVGNESMKASKGNKIRRVTIDTLYYNDDDSTQGSGVGIFCRKFCKIFTYKVTFNF
jgi:MFS family permease